MTIKATTFEAYLNSFDEQTQGWLMSIYETIHDCLTPSFESGMLYHMPSFYVSLKDYPRGYHAQRGTPLPFVSFAKQKHYVSIYFLPFTVNSEKQIYIEKLYKTMTGRLLKHGKSCLVFERQDDLPRSWLKILVESISREEWIAHYEQSVRTKDRKSQKILLLNNHNNTLDLNLLLSLFLKGRKEGITFRVDKFCLQTNRELEVNFYF